MPDRHATRVPTRRLALAWLVALGGPLLITSLPALDSRTLLLPGMSYLSVVVVAAALGRIWPGLAAATAAMVLLVVHDIQPLQPGWRATGDEAVAAVVFLVGAVIVSTAVDRMERARTAAERSMDRVSRLQSLTAALSDVQTTEELTSIVIGASVSELEGFRGTLSLIDEAGTHLDLVGAVGLSDELVARFKAYPLADDFPASECARTGQLVLISTKAERDARFPAIADTPPHHDHALACVPLTLGDRSLGAISLSFEGPRTFPPEDRQFLLAVGHQCAQALERTRLRMAELSAHDRQAFVAEATRLLASSLELEQTLAGVNRLVVPKMADSVSVHLFEQDELALVALAHVDPEREAIMRRLSRRDRDRSRDPYMLECFITGVPRLNPAIDPELWGQIAEDPEHQELLEALGTTSGIVVALRAQGRSLGVMTLGICASDRSFDKDDLDLVLEIADRIAVAVDNSVAHRARSEVARTLQRSLLPPQPLAIPGLEVASTYHPVSDGSEVGGDFFDVFPAGDGTDGHRRWGVVMGDVCGKGVEAAALTALARYTVRAVAPQSSSPSVALHRVNRTVLDFDPGERFCTIAHAMVEVATDVDGVTTASISLASGGHPLPLLLTAAGEVRPIGLVGGAIGLFPRPDLVDSYELLEPGDTVVLFTDGVTEARSPAGLFAPDLLEDTLGTCSGLPAAEIVRRIESAVLSFERGQLRDDFALLAIRVPDLPATSLGHDATGADDLFSEQYPPVAASVTLVRRGLSGWLSRHGSPAVRDDLVLVASELMSNAVRVARQRVQVRAWCEGRDLVLEVSDDGPGFTPGEGAPALPDSVSEQGRGLLLVDALTDDHTITSNLDGTTVRCRRAMT